MPEIGFLRDAAPTDGDARLRYFIDTTLTLPSAAAAYIVSRRLAKTFPDKAVVECSEGALDLREFAEGGHCTVSPRKQVHAQVVTEWRGPKDPLRRRMPNALLDVEWQGNRLAVLVITMDDSYGSGPHSWIIADTRDVAEDFMQTVIKSCTAMHGDIFVFEAGRFHRDRELTNAISAATCENLVLREGLQDEIVGDFERFFASRELYERHGIPWKRGALFIGPPGNGKTHLVKALVNRLAKPCLYVRNFETEHNAAPSEGIGRVFFRARRAAPCLVVLEDIDCLLAGPQRSYLLNELDGFAANTGVVVLATTNHPEKLDPSIMERPSRFDRKYHFDLPGRAERERFLLMWNGLLTEPLRVDAAGIAALADATDGFSFAYLKELMLSLLMRWVNNQAAVTAELAVEEVRVLRAQMKSDAKDQRKPQASTPPSSDDDDEEE